MKSKLNRLVLASSLLFSTLAAEAAGFRQLSVVDAGHAELKVGLWYPSNTAIAKQPNTEFGLPVALGAPLEGANGALIVISHGFGGWYAGHADTAQALADAGYIVAAPSHTGNTWSDMSSSIDQWALDRPRHISRVIDHLLGDAELQDNIDPDKIGFYGFSAGGYTGLSLLGAVPDFNHAQRHCLAQPEEFVCAENMIKAMLEAGMQQLPGMAWGADARIKAAALAAPGLGFAYSAATLAKVTASVQLWSGEMDESVPTASNAAALAEKLPGKPELHCIDKASHFAFMVVNCREAFKREDPEEYAMICGDAEGFDRRVFHDQMHSEMIRFYAVALNLNPKK